MNFYRRSPHTKYELQIKTIKMSHSKYNAHPDRHEKHIARYVFLYWDQNPKGSDSSDALVFYLEMAKILP